MMNRMRGSRNCEEASVRKEKIALASDLVPYCPLPYHYRYRKLSAIGGTGDHELSS